MDYNLVHKTAQEILLTVQEFLKKHGGMDNGYETFARGKICLNTSSRLDIRLPNQDDKSVKYFKDLGKDLYIQCREKIPKSLPPNFEFEVKAVPIQWGTYGVKVTAQIEVE